MIFRPQRRGPKWLLLEPLKSASGLGLKVLKDGEGGCYQLSLTKENRKTKVCLFSHALAIQLPSVTFYWQNLKGNHVIKWNI